MPQKFLTTEGEYATSVSEVPHPEPPRAPLERLTATDIYRKFRWTEETLGEASQYGFPRSLGMRTKPGTSQLESVWSAAQVELWRGRFLAFAKNVR